MVESDLTSWLCAQTWPDVRPEVAAADADAFMHPYGFIVLRLAVDRFEGWGIRVHLWPNTQRQVAMAGGQYIHRHGWDLMSRTLIGRVRHDLYVVTPSEGIATGWCAYDVESDVGTGRSVLRRTHCGLQAAVVDSHISDQKSDLTRVPAKDFHSTTAEVESPWTVTLAATATRGAEPSVVLAATSTPTVVVNDRVQSQSIEQLLATLDGLYRLESGLVDRWVSSVLLVRRRQLLVVRTFRFPQYWQPVGGQATAGDHDPIATALREVAEEAGLVLHADDLRPLGAVMRDRGSGMVHGFAADVPSNWTPVILESEIAEHRWMDPEELADTDCFDATRHFALEYARLRPRRTTERD